MERRDIMPDFVKVIDTAALAPGRVTIVTVNGHDLCLANYQGEFFALENKCPHRGGQLGDGTLDGADLICPLHKWDFDIRTGISRCRAGTRQRGLLAAMVPAS
jgi:nitrite reductase/ring-hydroxylating ferredoxin subunit